MTCLLHTRIIVMLFACVTVPALVACGTVPTQPQQVAPSAVPAGAPPNGFGMQAALAGQPCSAAFPSTPGTGSHPIRQLFANTIAVIVQGVTTGLAGGVVQGITGSITSWFDRKQPGGAQNAASGVAGYAPTATGYPAFAGAYPQPTAGFPQMPGQVPGQIPGQMPGAYPSAPTGFPQPGAGCPQVAAAYPQGVPAFPQAAPAAFPAPQMAAPYPSPATAYPASPAAYPATPTAAYPASPPAYPATASAYPPNPTAYPPNPTAYPQPAPVYGQTVPSYPQPAIGDPQNPGVFPQPGVATPASATLPAGAGPSPYAAAPIQVFDPKTGQMTTGLVSDPSTAAAGSPAAQPTIYAGLAYEVHLLGAGGTSTPVNAATYEFHTGDRFVVHFRPTLPGHLKVFNINPLGKRTRIDSADLAAGVMSTLGPYEFTAATGDESLQLTLSPCQSPELLATTRDIIKVSSKVGPSSGPVLSSCTMTSRSISEPQTRDIVKVALDDSTSFALDPVSPTELSSGNLAPREITIVFHHR